MNDRGPAYVELTPHLLLSGVKYPPVHHADGSDSHSAEPKEPQFTIKGL